jgi:hypothetical protein
MTGAGDRGPGAGAQAARFVVKLSLYQHKYLRRIIADHKAMGDCEERGFKLLFPDCEGLRAFQCRMYERMSGSTREFITREAIDKKIDAAVLKGVRRWARWR